MSAERREELLAHYNQNAIDVDWLPNPNQHSYRWRTVEGKWLTARRRVRNHQTLMKAIGKDVVSDLYVSTSRWLDPIDLPRLRDKERPHPILLDHLIVFDIDVAPLSLKNLEKAQRIAIELHNYLQSDLTIEFLSASFSGSKGFHLFYLDLEREKFAIEDPKQREEGVRDHRKQLLTRVIEDGFEVDPRVTADTRRIIRLPGSIHGTTGYQCTAVSLEQINQPIKELLKMIHRVESAQKIPKRAKAKKKGEKAKKQKKAEPQAEIQTRQTHMVEASTHISGTKDRSVLFFWLPLSWGEPQKAMERAVQLMEEEDLGICSFWQQGERILMLCPKALTLAQVIKMYSRNGLNKRASILKEREHDWIRISSVMSEDAEWSLELEPIGLFGQERDAKHVYSQSHLELEKRMGIHRRIDASVTLAGSLEPTLRLSVRQ